MSSIMQRILYKMYNIHSHNTLYKLKIYCPDSV
uniref:Uncharacterized protein n=1 Tax=Siphoviridae sp. ctP0x5 TaxID=2827863 RepID=A0A8S5TF01_9CAUD|nr:MAG TPA: hypothetical protein [Siphoviridae sp. ctP0x5]DAM50410.1 MAG TPA: hypothetical protein [Caudoviricetes sp.]